MAEQGPRGRLPGRTAVVLAAVAFVLLVLFAVLYVVRAGATHATSGLTSSEQAALDAGKQEVANLTTYRRSSFAADWQRALTGTTGALHAQQVPKKSSTQTNLVKNKIDSRGEVTAAGVQSSKKGSVSLLVFLNVYRVTPDGKSTLASTSRLVVTETKVGATWLLSDLQSVGLS